MNPISELIIEIKSISSNKSSLRKFGILFLVVLGGIGIAIAISRREQFPELLSMIFLGSGALFGLLGLAVPIALKPLYLFWMALAIVLGFIVSRIIMIVVYYLILTPIGLIMRLTGRDVLSRKQSKVESYWDTRPEADYDPAQTDRMF